MTIASSIENTSLYAQMIDSIGTYPSRESLYRTVEAVKSESQEVQEEVDFSSYYSNLENSDLLTLVGENVKQSAEDLEQSMINALENGMSVEDVCNIKLCMTAYKASCNIAKSTFELSV